MSQYHPCDDYDLSLKAVIWLKIWNQENLQNDLVEQCIRDYSYSSLKIKKKVAEGEEQTTEKFNPAPNTFISYVVKERKKNHKIS